MRSIAPAAFDGEERTGLLFIIPGSAGKTWPFVASTEVFIGRGGFCFARVGRTDFCSDAVVVVVGRAKFFN